MSDERKPNRAREIGKRRKCGQSVVYQIRLQGQLDRQWATWFEGMTIILAKNGDTLLVGEVADQAALHGLLSKIRDVGIPLLSVNRLQPDQLEGLDRAL